VTVSALNPRDRANTPILRTQYINLCYEDLTITPVFDFEAGAFSYYDPKTNTLYLGDGEQSLFHLDILEENAELENLEVFWQSAGGSTADNTEVKDGGHISLARENGRSDSGEPLWRIGHNLDHLSTSLFYLISKDLFYTAYARKYTYRSDWTDRNSGISDAEHAVYSAAQGQGITGWRVETD
jgi:hypothetical protein